MNNEDLDADAVTHNEDEKKAPIAVVNGSFKWEREEAKPTLEDIDVVVPKGSLTAVVGTVGAGKSSLVSGMNPCIRGLRTSIPTA